MISPKYPYPAESALAGNSAPSKDDLYCGFCNAPVSRKDEFCNNCGVLIRPPRGVKLAVTAGLFVISSAFFVVPLVFWSITKRLNATAKKLPTDRAAVNTSVSPASSRHSA